MKNIYETSVPENAADQSTLTHPFTHTVYHRGRIQVRVNRSELLGDQASSIARLQGSLIPPTTKPDFPAILDPTHIALGPFISGLGDNLFLDMVLGVGTNGVFGYNHSKVLQKLQRLGAILPGYMGAGTDFYYHSRHGAPAAQDLAALMIEYVQRDFGGEYMMNFANAGTEANENALKVAMFAKYRQIVSDLGDSGYAEMCSQLGIRPLRPEVDDLWSNYPFFVLAFDGAFHGRTGTSNTLSLSKKRQKEGYQAVPYVVHAPYGGKVDFNRFVDRTPLKDLISEGRLRALIDSGKAPLDLLAATIMEPVQGEGGYVIPDADFLSRLNDFVGECRTRGMCFVSDEVQTGLYRTGEFTGMRNWYRTYRNLRPDILTFAKPLHVGGVLIDKTILNNWPSGKFSGTWAEGNLLGIAMAVYTLQELKEVDPGLQVSYGDNARRAGDYLRSQLGELSARLEREYPGAGLVNRIRGVGQMNAFDLPDHDFQSAVAYESFLHGLHILGTGDRSIRLFGTVDQRAREADMVAEILFDVISAVAETRVNSGKVLSASH